MKCKGNVEYLTTARTPRIAVSDKVEVLNSFRRLLLLDDGAWSRLFTLLS